MESRRSRRVLSVLPWAALAIFSISSCGPSDFGASQDSEEEPATVAQGEVLVSALGRLEPLGEVINVGAPAGNRLGQLEVVEGQRVIAGQVLAYLDGYSERLADEAYSAAQLREAEKRMEAETRHGEALIQEEEARIKQLEKLQPLEIEAQEAEVRMIEAQLVTSQSDLERLHSLLEAEAVSQQELDHQALLVAQNQAQLDSARAQLIKLVTAREVDLALARQQLASSRANLLRNQSLIQLDSLRASLAQASAKLERTVIRSPADGQVLRIISRPGESLDQQAILEMGNTSHMLAIAEVYETAVGKVRVGQRARIKSLALPRELSGRVVHVGAMIRKNDVLDVDPTADTDARVVEVKIRLDESDEAAALVNLQVEVQIIVTPESQEVSDAE